MMGMLPWLKLIGIIAIPMIAIGGPIGLVYWLFKTGRIRYAAAGIGGGPWFTVTPTNREKFLKWTAAAVAAFLVVVAYGTFLAFQTKKTYFPLLWIIPTILILGVLLFLAYFKLLTVDSDREKVRKFMKSYGGSLSAWLLMIMLPIFEMAILFEDGLATVFGAPFVFFMIVLVAISVHYKTRVGLWALSLLLLIIWYNESTPQRLLDKTFGGISWVATTTAEEAVAAKDQLSFLGRAMQPGAGAKHPTEWARKTVTTPETEAYALFSTKNTGFNGSPILNPPAEAPYGNRQANYNNGQTSAPAKPQTVKLEQKKPTTMTIEPKLVKWTSTAPLPPGQCVRAGIGFPDTWNDTNDRRLPLYEEWQKISTVGKTYPLLSVDGERATVVVTDDLTKCSQS